MKKIGNWRANLAFIIIVLLWAAVISRLFFLQVLNHKYYQAQALGQQVSLGQITGPRGQIFCASSSDKKGNEASGELKSLAINKDYWIASANPQIIENKENFAQLLSTAIGITKDEILQDLQADSTYALIKKDLSKEELKNTKELNLKGLFLENNLKRFYPQAQMASHLLGFLGGEGAGQYGIEGYYEEQLKGRFGVQQSSKGLDPILNGGSQDSLSGSDLYLTIDYNIQFQAESLLEKTASKLGITSGQIIVLKPDSGRIIALANYPFFDPNNYSKEKDMETFQNGAVQKLFEPGSIMKPFTMASAINEGKITPDTIYTDTGVVKFGTKTIHNFGNEVYGEKTMTEVLESSINTGAVFAEQQISHEVFLDYLDRFGFFRETGVDLQGEVHSNNSALQNNGPDMNFATAAFGQGIELTPMQIARAFCAIANGGKLVKPYIVDKIVNGAEEEKNKPEISSPVITKKTSLDVVKMLVNVVDNGFNSVAKIPGYYLAGKTGTAQIPLKNGRGYEADDKTIQSFVGFGPAYNPQFLIMVKLDQPKVSKSSLSAVPVFKELAQYIINYWQIPPDYDASKK